jgi:hypothetical protein
VQDATWTPRLLDAVRTGEREAFERFDYWSAIEDRA